MKSCPIVRLNYTTIEEGSEFEYLFSKVSRYLVELELQESNTV